MAAIDPNQTADKLIVQRASASAGYKGAAVRVVDGQISLCSSTYNHNRTLSENPLPEWRSSC